MSNKQNCLNCGLKFYPHGGQMFCSKGCRLAYYKRMKPDGERLLKRLRSIKYYRENFIEEQKFGGEVKFEFMECTKCFSKFAVEMNTMFPQKTIVCPFCRTEIYDHYCPLPYEAVRREK